MIKAEIVDLFRYYSNEWSVLCKMLINEEIFIQFRAVSCLSNPGLPATPGTLQRLIAAH